MQAVARFYSSKRVTIGILKEALKSNLVGRSKSYATSVKDETVKAHKVRNRIPKQERRAAIISFVENYTSNEGRFPTISLVRKEIGGSHYVVRAIVQELEYKYKLAQVSQCNQVPPTDLKEASSGTISESIGEKIAPTVSAAKKDTTKRGERSMVFEAEGVRKVELSGQASHVIVEEQTHVVPSGTSHTTTNMDKKQPPLKVKEVKEAGKAETRTQTLHDTQTEAKNFRMSDEVAESEEIQGKQISNEHDRSSTTEESLWGTLKSFSDKIVNFWKKL